MKKDSARSWMPPAWRRLLLVGFTAEDRERLAPILAGAADAAVIDHCSPQRFDEAAGDEPGTVLILPGQVQGAPSLEWLRSLRSTGEPLPALILAPPNGPGDVDSAPPVDLSAVDILHNATPDAWQLRRSLGYLRQSVADERLADELRRRLQAFSAAGTADADHARIMEIARGLRAQLEDKEAEAERLAARCEELQRRQSAGEDRPEQRRIRELEEELKRSEELRRGQELAMIELRRRHGEMTGQGENGGTTGDLMARLMLSEWMRTGQQETLRYLQQRVDEMESHFGALASLLEPAGTGGEMPPSRLLEEVAQRLTAYERERSDQQGTIVRMSHSLAVQQVDDTLDDVQSRRNAIQRLTDAMSYAQRFDAPLACLLISIDDPEALRRAHGSVAYDYLLVQVAQRLKLSLRQHDVLLRYDSESFVLISDASSTRGAYTHADRLIDQVTAEAVSFGEKNLRPSVFIAVVLRRDSMKDASELIRRAQQVLEKGRRQWGPGRVAIDPRSVKEEGDRGT